jgi:hypothetical protein
MRVGQGSFLERNAGARLVSTCADDIYRLERIIILFEYIDEFRVTSWLSLLVSRNMISLGDNR